MESIKIDNFKLKNGLLIPAIGYGPDVVEGLRYREYRSLEYRIRNRLYKNTVGRYKYVNSVKTFLDCGGRLIDYSASYGSGKLIVNGIEKSRVDRGNIVLTTRVSNNAQFGGYIEREYEEQLNGFRTDYFDILMFHWPIPGLYENTWLKMMELKNRGLCRVLGVANCNIHHLKRIKEISGEYPEINQVEVHPLFTQKDMVSFCKENNIQLEAYTPTARQDDRIYGPKLMKELSKKYNKTITQLILRWHIQNGIVPIYRSMNKQHVIENVRIFDFCIDKEDMKRIDALNINSRRRYDPDNCDFTSL